MSSDYRSRLLPCPFCNGTDFRIELSNNGKIVTEFAELASIKCNSCSAEFRFVNAVHEHYEHINGDMYRKVPTKYAEDVMVEKWNRRDWKDDGSGVL